MHLPPHIYQALLLGTEKSGETLSKTLGDGKPVEEALLDWLAKQHWRQRAGFLPTNNFTPLEKDPEVAVDKPEMARLLKRVVNHRYHDAMMLATLEHMASSGKLWPPVLLPNLLDWGKPRRHLHGLVTKVAGSRGKWLARLNPDWAFSAEAAKVEDWDLAPFTARLALVRQLKEEPDLAYRLVASTFEHEDTTGKTLLLAAMPSPPDDYLPFVTEATKHRSKEVKRQANYLLLKSPNSELSEMARQSVKQAIFIASAGLLGGKKISVKLPKLKPEWMNTLPLVETEKMWVDELHLASLVSSVPFSFWPEYTKLQVPEFLKLVEKLDKSEPFINGLLASMLFWGDFTHLELLLQSYLTCRKENPKAALSFLTLLDFLPNQGFNNILSTILKDNTPGVDAPMLRKILENVTKRWSEANTQAIMSRLRWEVGRNNPYNQWGLKPLFRNAAMCLPPSLYAQMDAFWQDKDRHQSHQMDISDFLSVLQLRAEVERLC